MKIAVTGARGFIGHHLTRALADRGHVVVPINRDDWDLTSQTSPAMLLDGCHAVVHLAALVHVRNRPGDRQFVRTMFETNVRGTASLARAAAERGVRRFVFLSTASVYGRRNGARAIDEASPVHPDTPYGHSKSAAEETLQAVSNHTGLMTVALRPPLVYGAGARGNLQTFIRLVSHGLPMPEGVLAARRSFLSVTNLCDLVARALEADHLPRSAYVAAEPARLVADIYYGLCAAAGRRARVVPFSQGVLRWTLNAIGWSETARAILDDFVIDASAAQRELNWSPRDLFAEELRQAITEARRS